MTLGDREAPRVLVIGPDLPHLGVAGSILLHRLFQGWPPRSLLAAGPSVPANILKYPCRFLTYQPPLGRFEQTRAVRFLRLLRGLRVIPAGRIAPPDFQPDVVVHILSSLAYSEAAYSYSLRSGVPLVLILHDDPEEFNGSYSWANHLTRRQVQRIYCHASRRLCISPELECLLRERYGAAGEVMYPNRSEFISPRHPQAAVPLKVTGRLTLGFAGSQSYGYGPRLQELVPILRRAQTTVRVYGGNLPDTDCADVLVNMGRLKSPEILWQHVQNECDGVLLPYCFPNQGHQELYRTHFPSKLPEYLALGMPVLITGPQYANGVKWGLRNPDSCLVITEQAGDQWINVLTQLRQDADLRVRLAATAVLSGNRDFEPNNIRSFFCKAITETASISRGNSAE